MTSFAGVASGALAGEAADIVDALAAIDAWVRFTLVVLKVAQLAGESCNRGDNKGRLRRLVACNGTCRLRLNGLIMLMRHGNE